MIPLEWWGLGVDYREALERQRLRRERILEGRGGECLAALEHAAVITTGRRDAGDLAAVGLPVVATERGGLATWHGPGQLVGYLLLDLGRRALGPRLVVEAVEQGLIDWLQGRGVPAGRREGAPGVWVAGRKIAAIGLHFRRGVSMHGFALNLQVRDAPWSRFVPCGIADAGVVSLHEIEEGAPSPRDAALSVCASVRARLLTPGTEAATYEAPIGV